MAVNGVEIEVGQVWETRNGERAYVQGFDNSDEQYPVRIDRIGADRMITAEGKSSLTSGPCRLDFVKLLSPCVEEIQIPQPRTLFEAKPIDMAAPGYECLANVLQMAYNQAAVGKGVERHAAVGEPFADQVMQIGAAKFGTGALLFQAFKKSEESQRLPHDRAVNELLGAIVYLAGAVIALEKAK